MTRLAAVLLFFGSQLAFAQFPGPPPDPPKASEPSTQPKSDTSQDPPEEDEQMKPEVYSFNPLKAVKVVKVGLFYYKKGNYIAAAKRFEESTKWNPRYAEGYLRAGEAYEKLNETKKARDAYSKYLELAPDGKEASAVKKKLSEKSGDLAKK